MMMIGLAAFALVLAAVPALLFHANLREYRPPPAASRLPGDAKVRSLSVLIPAQRGEHNRRCFAGGPGQPGRRV